MRLPNQILDAYDHIDAGTPQDLLKIAKTAPENLHVMTSEERSGLSQHDFALSFITKEATVMRRFPIKTHDDTWLSNAMLGKTAHKLPQDAAGIAACFIKKACEKFEITPDPKIVELAKEASSNLYVEQDNDIPSVRLRKTATMSEFAEAEKIAGNHTFAQYAFPKPENVKMGEKYFAKFASKMPLEVRHGYAEALQKRAGELGMQDLTGEVGKYASDHYSALIGAHIRSRSSLLDGREGKYASALNNLSAARKQYPPSDFAKALHSFDKHAGLVKYYGSTLTDPYLATFATAPDKYAGYRTKTASGTELNPDQLKQLALSKYARIKEYFGSSLADEFKKEPMAIFDSLPMDSKEIIAGIADGTV